MRGGSGVDSDTLLASFGKRLASLTNILAFSSNSWDIYQYTGAK
jgi:hypothetical protein